MALLEIQDLDAIGVLAPEPLALPVEALRFHERGQILLKNRIDDLGWMHALSDTQVLGFLPLVILVHHLSKRAKKVFIIWPAGWHTIIRPTSRSCNELCASRKQAVSRPEVTLPVSSPSTEEELMTPRRKLPPTLDLLRSPSTQPKHQVIPTGKPALPWKNSGVARRTEKFGVPASAGGARNMPGR